MCSVIVTPVSLLLSQATIKEQIGALVPNFSMADYFGVKQYS